MPGGILLSAAVLAEVALVAAAAQFGDFTVAGHATRFVVLIWGAAAFFLCAVVQFGRHGRLSRAAEEEEETSARAWWTDIRMIVFWGTALALRLAMIGCPPADDLWRYIWEGEIQRHGINPYVTSPDAPALLPLRTEEWKRINHRETAAIYPPAAELLFRGLASVKQSPTLFKVVFVIADLMTVCVLLRLCRPATDGGRIISRAGFTILSGSKEARAYETVAWYAWNPAVVYAFAGAGHYDSLMLLTVSGAFLILDRADFERTSRSSTPHGTEHPAASAWAAAALLGMAIALKIVPTFLVPAAALALRSQSAVLLASAGIPFALAYFYGGLSVVLAPLAKFADVTRFHDLFWWLAEAVFGPNPFQRNWPFTVGIFVASAIVVWAFRRDWRRCALWLFGVVLIFESRPSSMVCGLDSSVGYLA
jgi:hypothetical protein